ncbi:GGDEF domain-containing protein [Pseudomonas stutzeri]|nr:GGDEF domain-containing protein [Stutzerimonas stutzeri]
MESPSPALRRSVRSRLRRFSWLLAGVLLATTVALLVSQLNLQRSLAALERSLLPRWQIAQQLHTDARTLSAQAARLPLALSQGELDTVRMRVDTQLGLLDEDLARLQALPGADADGLGLPQVLQQLRTAIGRSDALARERIALGWSHALTLEASREVNALRRLERDLARLIDEQTLILTSYASALTSDLDGLLEAQRRRLGLLRWAQTLLILLAGALIGALLLAQSRLLERQLLQPIDSLRRTMSAGTVDQRLLHAETPGDELEAMQVELAHLLDRLTEQNLILAQRATTDPLTGLANRRRLFELLEHESLRHQRQGLPLSVLAIDVDHFKRINDGWGHAVGDRVLQALAELLAGALRKSDLVARYGGEEFLAVLLEADGEAACTVAEHLRRQAAELTLGAGEASAATIRIGISIGVATLHDGESVQALIDRADRALYRAKHEGRNRVCRAEPARSPRPAATPDCAPPTGR